MALNKLICRGHPKFISGLLHLKRAGPVCCGIHGTQIYMRTEKEISAEPIKFTSSAANVPSKFKPREANKYEPLIVISSLFVFMVYFLYLREENDLDEMIYRPVPVLEELHLSQTIPELKEKGIDTRHLEARLQELVAQRLAAEKQALEI
ncbi:unnamed protein product [Candidula unifasciata]|uniref:Uncharacterized protein n=1 Tax=Candidula unifasciata TaxID=100452 RepID=A0A8S3YRD0_9EUPU|nr:unnamed protein product [Candidula unifasciata]